MTEALQVHQGAAALSAVGQYTPEQVELIANTVARGATKDELGMFLAVCGRTGLDPFTKQIHFVKRWDSKAGKEVGAIQTGIDGYRLVAQRSGEYQGQVGPWWCGPDGVWKDLWTDPAPPFAARVGVWRKGFREPLYAIARWDAYVQTRKDGKPNHFWAVMGPEQLAKCAESLGLRKAFPNELSGLYTREEMQQAENETKAGSAAVVDAGGETENETKARWRQEDEIARKRDRDWHVEFVSLCREHGFVGRGKKLEAVNLILLTISKKNAMDGGGSTWVGALTSSPPKDDSFYREAVEWIEAHGWPKPEPIDAGAQQADWSPVGPPEIPESWQPFAEPVEFVAAAIRVLPDAYFSHSKGEAIPIDGMALPHLEAAIQKLEASANGLLPADPHNGPKVLEALKAMRDKRRGEAVDEAQRKVGAT